MGIARHFNSGVSTFDTPTEYINSPVSSETYTEQTVCAWVKRDYFGSTRNGIMGRMFGATNGWMLFVDENNKLNYHILTSVTGAVTTTSTEPLDLFDWTFVAATYDADSVGTEIKLWAGNTAENLKQVGVGTATGFIAELGVRVILFGNVLAGVEFSGGPVIGWNGSADQFGIWSIGLTTEELKEAMRCGTRVQPGAIKFIVDVDGTDPEIGLTVNLADGGTFGVNGTEVVYGPNVGCDYVPEGDRTGDEFFELFIPFGVVSPPAPPGGGGSENIITKFPLRHFTMPEFSPAITPLLGLRGPYILASDNTQNSRIFAIDHSFKNDVGAQIRCELETGNITHGTFNQKRCEYYRFYVKRVDDGFFTLYVNDENKGFDSGVVVTLDPLENAEYVMTEVRNMGTYRSRRLKIVHQSATDDFELVRVEEGYTVLRS